MPVPQFCSPRGERLVVSHPACLLSDKHRLYSEMGLHKICCMVKARLACPSGQDLGITAFWPREDRAGARATFSLPRKFAGLSQGGDRQVPEAASAGGHGCTGESAPPISYIWPWALPPTWLCHIWLLSAPSQETCLDCPHPHWSHPMRLLEPLTDAVEWWFGAEERALTWASRVADLLWELRPQFSSLSRSFSHSTNMC